MTLPLWVVIFDIAFIIIQSIYFTAKGKIGIAIIINLVMAVVNFGLVSIFKLPF